MWLAGKQDGRKTPKESSSQAAKTKNFVPQKQKTVKATNSQKKNYAKFNLTFVVVLVVGIVVVVVVGSGSHFCAFHFSFLPAGKCSKLRPGSEFSIFHFPRPETRNLPAWLVHT